MRGKPILIIVALLAIAPMLAACDSFDMDKLDVFKLNEKKKLQGERKPLFPEGVPGVAQGIPPDLVKGYQPPPQPAETKVAEPEPAKQKPKPRVVKRAAKPTQVTVQPTQPTQPTQQQQAQQPAWPEPKAQPTGTQAPWPATTQQQPSPWPAAPAPNTFQR
jgi:FtsZ-interacting cell division protein ZipA